MVRRHLAKGPIHNFLLVGDGFLPEAKTPDTLLLHLVFCILQNRLSSISRERLIHLSLLRFRDGLIM